MKKKAIILFLSTLVALTSAKAIELEFLQGDQASACEALLCLASPVKPPECAASIARYFAIKFKKPWKTVQARKNFLNLCPTSSTTSDPEMQKYVNDILPNLEGECSIEALDKRVERVVLRVIEICESDGGTRECKKANVYGFRINPKPTNSCALLSSNKYADYRLKYTCNGVFYEQVDWNNGYTKEKISKQVYDSLKDSEKTAEKIKVGFNRYETIYYKKIPIKKDCWINGSK